VCNGLVDTTLTLVNHECGDREVYQTQWYRRVANMLLSLLTLVFLVCGALIVIKKLESSFSVSLPVHVRSARPGELRPDLIAPDSNGWPPGSGIQQAHNRTDL
jgi:hypothetical protein